MSWRDRDYARGPAGYDAGGGMRIGGGLTGGLFDGSTVHTLIVINVAVFIACQLTGGYPRVGLSLQHGEVIHQGGSWIYRWFFLTAPSVLEQGQVWRLLTCTFLHANFLHIFMNMLGLYFLGPPLEARWGPRVTLTVYLLFGVVANLFYLALAATGYFGLWGVSLVGASGSVLALLGSAAVMFPHAVVFVYGILPLKIRTAAIIFGLMYAYNLKVRGANAGGDACHLMGLLCGVWWAMKGQYWWDARGRFAWGRLRGRLGSAAGRRPVMRPGYGRTEPAGGGFKERMRRREIDQADVDRILQKVYESGLHALSEEEKQTLREATERLQK